MMSTQNDDPLNHKKRIFNTISSKPKSKSNETLVPPKIEEQQE